MIAAALKGRSQGRSPLLGRRMSEGGIEKGEGRRQGWRDGGREEWREGKKIRGITNIEAEEAVASSFFFGPYE